MHDFQRHVVFVGADQDGLVGLEHGRPQQIGGGDRRVVRENTVRVEQVVVRVGRIVRLDLDAIHVHAHAERAARHDRLHASLGQQPVAGLEVFEPRGGAVLTDYPVAVGGHKRLGGGAKLPRRVRHCAERRAHTSEVAAEVVRLDVGELLDVVGGDLLAAAVVRVEEPECALDGADGSPPEQAGNHVGRRKPSGPPVICSSQMLQKR